MGARRKFQSENSPVPVPVAPATVRESALLSDRFDPWLVGGLSIALLIGFVLYVPDNASNYRLSIMMYWASMFCNWPHFMMSYQLLYRDRRQDLLKKPSYFWAAFIVPVCLLATIGYGFYRRDQLIFPLMIHVMYLTVGWHYVKQVFGTMVVSSSLKGFYFHKIERSALLFNLYSLWTLSFLNGQAVAGEVDFFGLKYDLVGVSSEWLQVSLGAVVLTGLISAGLMVRRYLKDGTRPANTALVSYATLYVWYLPATQHPHFFYVIPFFHSLQ